MNKKPATLSPSLVAVKGQAMAVDSMGQCALEDSGERGLGGDSKDSTASKVSAPLNFKVDNEFRRRFRQRAAEADLKLNELLREALDAWEHARGLR